MLATHAIRARVAASKWVWFGRRKIWFVYGVGQTLAVTMRTTGGMPVEIGSEALLLDCEGKAKIGFRAGRPRRYYLDFKAYGLEPEGYYGVWLDGRSLSSQQQDEFECMSNMVDDWFTHVDDVDLNLLRIQIGGKFRISNDVMTRL